jgi:hypothetical protein
VHLMYLNVIGHQILKIIHIIIIICGDLLSLMLTVEIFVSAGVVWLSF